MYWWVHILFIEITLWSLPFFLFMMPRFSPCNFSFCQAKKSKLTKAAQLNVSKVVPSDAVELPQLQVDSETQSLPEIGLRSEDATCSVNLEDNTLLRLSANQCGTDDSLLDSQTSGISAQPLTNQKKGFSVYFLTHKIAIVIC